MLLRLRTKLSEYERQLRASMNRDLSTTAGRRNAWIDYHLFDHAFVREFWSNFGTVTDGVYRSNHPSPRRLKQMKAMGIKAVLNLRGEGRSGHFLIEQEACRRLGLELVSSAIASRVPPQRKTLQRLLEKMRGMPKPFLMHCKSGADRSGFAAALYLAVIEGRPLAEARQQLGLKYLHLSFTSTGIVDHFFDVYEARNAQSPIPLERWINEEYTAEALGASWAAKGGRTGHDR